MTQYKFIKMRMVTYKEIRRAFKPLYKESAAAYFDRLARFISSEQFWKNVEDKSHLRK